MRFFFEEQKQLPFFILHTFLTPLPMPIGPQAELLPACLPACNKLGGNPLLLPTHSACCWSSPLGHAHWRHWLRALASAWLVVPSPVALALAVVIFCAVLTVKRLQAILAIKAAGPPHCAANSKSVFEHIRLHSFHLRHTLLFLWPQSKTVAF